MKLRRPFRLGLLRLSLLAIAVGIVTGFGAVIFRALIGLIHNIAFLGSFAIDYDASLFTPPGSPPASCSPMSSAGTNR